MSSSLALGCDLGGTRIKAALLRGTRVVARVVRPVPAGGAAREVIEAIAGAALEALAAGAAGGVAGPLACGVAVPGFLDARRRGVVHLSNLPSLDGVPLAARLERRLRAAAAPVGEVILDADTNAAAFGEARLGAGRGGRRVLAISLGTGLGVAFVAGGAVVRVSHHTVGQAAHIPIAAAGRRCSCGHRGCAESLLAARGIIWRARRAGLPAAWRRSPQTLAAAAAGGGPDALAAWRETGELLGRLIGILGNFLSPDRVVLTGGIAKASPHFLDAARRSAASVLHPRVASALHILPGRLGDHAGACGIACLARGARGRS